MDNILQDTMDYASWYIDDISVFSQKWSSYLQHLDTVFSYLQEAGLTLQLRKCTFGVEFLGHSIGDVKISPQEAKTLTVSNFKRPRTKKYARCILILAGYYRRYIKNFSSLIAPLSDLTKALCSDSVKWIDKCQKAFDLLKLALTARLTLDPPDYGIKLCCKQMHKLCCKRTHRTEG